MTPVAKYMARSGAIHRNHIKAASRNATMNTPINAWSCVGGPATIAICRASIPLYRVPEIVTRGRFPDGGESDSTWRTQEARHVGSDTIAPGF